MLIYWINTKKYANGNNLSEIIDNLCCQGDHHMVEKEDGAGVCVAGDPTEHPVISLYTECRQGTGSNEHEKQD